MASSEWSAVESAELQLHVHHPITKVAATKFMRYMWLLSRLVSLSIEHILSEESTIDGLSRPALLPHYGVFLPHTRYTVSDEVEAQAVTSLDDGFTPSRRPDVRRYPIEE